MKRQEEKESQTFPLYGDILDSIVCHVPTLDLLPASHVSSTWRLAVASSLLRRPRLKPLLFLHLLPRVPSLASVAYDPLSRSWSPLPRRAPLPASATWRDLHPPPLVSRSDPVAAQVGPSLVLAGGTWEFEDHSCAVEVLDLKSPSPRWTLRDPLPDEFRQSSSATWLSSATSDEKLYILDKDSGLLSSFDPATGKWTSTCELKPDPSIQVSAIGFFNDRNRIVLVGFLSDPIRLKIWEVDLDLDSDPIRFVEIGEMPVRLVEGLTSSGLGMTRIGFGLVGEYGYFWNPGDFSEGAVFWEIGDGKWERVEPPNEVDRDPMARFVVGCGRAGLVELELMFGSRRQK